MARSLVLISFLIAVALGRSIYQPARRVEQSLVDRSTYLGGWPLAAVPCPSDAPVSCSTGISSQINQQCCPRGNTCYSWPATIPPVCCPSSQNCVGQLQNLPVCANSTWNMYELADSNYFCCEVGQIGVIPTTGYAGICQAQDQAVPSSLRATLINQVGAATAAASSTGTSLTGSETTGISSTPTSPDKATSTSDGTTSLATSPSSVGTSSSSPPPPSKSNSSGGGVHLPSGAIAGIAIGGAIVVAVLIFILWKSCGKNRRLPSHGLNPKLPPDGLQQPPIYDTLLPERSSQPVSQVVTKHKVGPVMGAKQVYQPVCGVGEVDGENRHVWRAEMAP